MNLAAGGFVAEVVMPCIDVHQIRAERRYHELCFCSPPLRGGCVAVLTAAK